MAETKEQFRKRAELAQQSKIKLGKSALSGTLGLPGDAAELAAYGAFTPSASLKTRLLRPPMPPGVETRPTIASPKFRGTSADIAEGLGVDPSSGEFVAGQAFSIDPFSKFTAAIKAAKALKLADLGFLGALGSIVQLGKRADKMKAAGKSADEIAAALKVKEAPTQSGWKKLSEKLPVQAFGGERVMLKRTLQEQIMASDVMKDLKNYMTEEELLMLTPETIEAMETVAQTGKTRSGKPITILLGKEQIPRLEKEDLSALAFAGRFKQGWYRHGAEQLQNVFGEDTERFIALLAATSPQTSVEMNLENALRVWRSWTDAGRPTDTKEIRRLMGKSVVGTGTEKSVMNAWVNNSLTALTAKDPTKIELSGPKADSFMKNLLSNLDEVTLDTWQGRAYNLLQEVFGGKTLKATEGRGVKSPGYILSAAATRRAADYLSKRTGTTWKPAEVQETVWSFVKALYEKRKSPGGRAKSMDELYLELSPNEIANVPDFASLIRTDKYGSILEGTEYGRRISSVEQFQPSAEAYAATPYRGFGADIERAVGGLEQQYRATDTSRITKTIRDRIHRAVVASGTGTGTVNRPYTAGSVSNPGRSLKGLGKLTKFNLSSVDQARINSLGYSTPDFYELPKTPEATARFQESILESKKVSTFGSAVYVYSPEEYSGMRLFLSKDGGTGFALKEDDIVSVFNSVNSPHKGTTLSALMLAVQEGGRKLDAFDSALPHIYSKVGFRISSRTAWNDDFAPPEWNKELFKKWNQGEPDVVFMHYDPDSTEVFDQLSGPYNPEDAARNSLLRDDYDDAVELQTQNVLESQQRFKKLKRLPGEEAERLGFDIPKAPWKVEERSLVPAAHTQVAVDKILEGLPLSRRLELTPEKSRMGGGSMLPPGPTFTSPALNAVREVSKDALPANQWLRQLQGRGVKEDEIVWTGVGDWLKSRKGNVSKADLEQYLDANKIQIQEVVKGSQGESVELFPDASATQFSDPKLQLPGGENYRELVLTLPSGFSSPGLPKGYSVVPLNGDPYGRKFTVAGPDGVGTPIAGETKEEAEKYAYDSLRQTKLDYPLSHSLPSINYTGGHYDEPNIVAHIRFNERTDADGNKVLFIEEIQSDWAQKGREKGFLTEKNQEIANLIKEKDGIIERGYSFMNDEGGTSFKIDPRDQERYNEIQLILDKTPLDDMPGGPEKVPSAPFIMDTNQWVALSLKRMVRWAADNKFDKIGWTTGAQQAARYDLSKEISALHYDPESGHLVAYGLGERHRPEHGRQQRTPLVDKTVPKSELSQHIGKEAARKLLATESVPLKYGKGVTRGEQGEKILGKYHMLEDQELVIGEEGMKGFYDQIVNDQAKALGKKYGAKVETSDIGSAHSLRPVTDGRQWRIYVETDDPITDHHWMDPATTRTPVFKSREEAAAKIKDIDYKGIPVSTLNLTPKLREAARKGLPYMVVLPPVVIGSQMMQQQAPVPEAQVPAAQVRASRILEEAVP